MGYVGEEDTGVPPTERANTSFELEEVKRNLTLQSF